MKNPNIVDIKSVITEYPKTSQKSSKTIEKAEKLGFNSSLYSDKKSENFLNNLNNTFKGLTSTYNVEF